MFDFPYSYKKDSNTTPNNIKGDINDEKYTRFSTNNKKEQIL